MSKNPTDLLTKVRNTINTFGLLNSDDRVMVGFSTGPDSVALLALLIELDLRPDLCYIDHGLRPVQEEIELAKEYARKYDLKCHIKKIDNPKTTEAEMREKRYQILHQIAEEKHCTKIALGHTLNDQLETIIINLIRGCSRIRPIPPKRGGIIRPLIEVTRTEIVDYLQKNQLHYSIDPTNRNLDYTRNRIRHKVIPVLLGINPGLFNQLGRNIRIWLEEDYFLDSLIPESTTKDLDLTILKTYNPPMRTRAVRKWIGSTCRIKPNAQMIGDIIGLIEGQSGKRVEIKDGICVVREFNHLHISDETKKPFRSQLAIPGELRIEPGSIKTQIVKEYPSSFLADAAFFDIEKLDLPLYIKSWSNGDQIAPFGLAGKKKVKDIWNEKRIPIHRRGEIPIVADQKDILWIAGVVRSNKAPIARETKHILRILYETE